MASEDKYVDAPLDTSASSLTHSSVEEDAECFLFNFPANFDPEALSSAKLKLGPARPVAHIVSHISTTAGHFAVWEMPTRDAPPFINLFPDAKSKQLALGKPFTRYFNILPEIVIPPADKPENIVRIPPTAQPPVLKLHWHPPGWEQPPASASAPATAKKSKKRKHSEITASPAPAPEEKPQVKPVEPAEGQEPKKKKAKKSKKPEPSL